ncbi:MAG: leucyl aminopeptidase family protein [Betaproteobacteria bacterium]
MPEPPRVKAVSRIPAMEDFPGDHLLIVSAKDFPVAKILAHELRHLVQSRGKPKSVSANAPVTDPVAATIGGRLVVWAQWDAESSAFAQQTAMRKALELLLKECPQEISIVVQADAAEDECAALATYVAAVNSQYKLGRHTLKKVEAHATLQTVQLFGTSKNFSAAHPLAIARGNLLSRSLTLRSPNDLTPARYRRDIAKLASAEGWTAREYPYKALLKVGAGAFCAVAQGSPDQVAAIVHLTYAPKHKSKHLPHVSLVGKGICMDTGGHGLKSAKSMYGMHEDMNGSAVALGILKAAADLQMPVVIDAWLAIAQNHIGPLAYQPGDVVTALDGTTIEVVHTDAEGRMVLADTLTMAAKRKPDLMLDFATLTGAMMYAMGTRMSGVFANRPALGEGAVAGGVASGERVSLFPMDPDYDAALESKVADVKQCLVSSEADAIYAARFLSRFVGDVPWIHMDLSAYRNEGGLGAVSDDLSGFGVAWGVAQVENLSRRG